MRASVSFSISETGRVEVGDQPGPDHLVAARARSAAAKSSIAGKSCIASARGSGRGSSVDQRLVHLHARPARAAPRCRARSTSSRRLAAELLARGWSTIGALVAGRPGRRPRSRASLRQDHAVAVAADHGAVGVGGEDVGDELRRARRRRSRRGSAGRRSATARPSRSASAGEAEPAVELAGVAVGELGRAPRRSAPAVQSAATRSRISASGMTRRRLDRVDAQRRQAAAGELDQVGLDADLAPRRRRSRKAGSSAMPPRRLGVERDACRAPSPSRRRSPRAVAPPASRSSMCRGVLGDLPLRLLERALLRELGRGLLEGRGGRAEHRVDPVERRPERGRSPARRCRGRRRRRPRRAPRAPARRRSTKPWSISSGFRPRSAASASKSISPASSRALAAAASSAVPKPMRSSTRRSGVAILVGRGVVGGAQLVLGDLDRRGQRLRRHARVGDLPGLGPGVAVGEMRVVLALELGVGRGRHRLGQQARVEAHPVEAPPLAEEGEHGQRAALSGSAAADCTAPATQVAGRLAAEQLLELRRASGRSARARRHRPRGRTCRRCRGRRAWPSPGRGWCRRRSRARAAPPPGRARRR